MVTQEGINIFNSYYLFIYVGTFYGHGSYFARDASYSVKYGKCIFYSYVLTGDYCQGQALMKDVPIKSNESALKYDSVVNNISDPSIFVVFSDNHAYPAYLINLI